MPPSNDELIGLDARDQDTAHRLGNLQAIGGLPIQFADAESEDRVLIGPGPVGRGRLRAVLAGFARRTFRQLDGDRLLLAVAHDLQARG
jgi:hypothetical protein